MSERPSPSHSLRERAQYRVNSALRCSGHAGGMTDPILSPASGRGAMRFAGYAALFDRVDRGGDVVRAGAFARALQGGAGSVPLLWQHQAGRPIGRVEYLREDKRGLRVIGQVADDKAASLLAAGAVSGLSFGYRVRDAKGAEPRELIDLELVEVSLVTFPMQPAARVHAVEAIATLARSEADRR